MSFPAPTARERLLFKPELAFSADGSKFALAMSQDGPEVSVWNIRSKTPIKTFVEVPKYGIGRRVRNLQFSSGKSGKEALVFVEVCPMFTFWYPRLSNRWSEFLESSSPLLRNHSCDRCDVVWDGRNCFLKVQRVRQSWNVHRSGCTFLRSKWGNSVCRIWRNNLRVGHAEKWAWSRMVDWGGVGCLAQQIYFITLFVVHLNK